MCAPPLVGHLSMLQPLELDGTSTSIVLLVALALAPTVFLLWLFYHMDRYKHESIRLLSVTFFLGALVTIPALGLELILQALIPAGDDLVSIFLFFLVGVAVRRRDAQVPCRPGLRLSVGPLRRADGWDRPRGRRRPGLCDGREPRLFAAVWGGDRHREGFRERPQSRSVRGHHRILSGRGEVPR